MRLALISTLVFTLGCSSGLESDGQVVDAEPGYRLALLEPGEGSTGYVPLVDGVRTEWNLSSGIVVLGPEDQDLAPGDPGPPLYRLELHLGATIENGEVAVDLVRYSTTDATVGTPQQLNGKLYALAAPVICAVESISAAHITVSEICEISLERVIVHEGDQPETINGFGFTFTAVDF
ncbi:MAG: hypothetical protein HKO53_03245 [Gemmatimonadetes bacterium]|nr:hypothetical protein [Gemmatimonadota bacterium]